MASPIGEMAACARVVGELEEGNSSDINNGVEDTRLCFHCGRRGHGTEDCPDS